MSFPIDHCLSRTVAFVIESLFTSEVSRCCGNLRKKSSKCLRNKTRFTYSLVEFFLATLIFIVGHCFLLRNDIMKNVKQMNLNFI